MMKLELTEMFKIKLSKLLAVGVLSLVLLGTVAMRPVQPAYAQTPPPPTPIETCQSVGGFSWLLCRGLELVDDMMGGLQSVIEDFLAFDIPGATSPNAATTPPATQMLYDAWTSFRNIANILFVIIFVIVIFGQAISIGVFDAYTIRKVIPRLVVAVIAIQASWFICTYMITLFNYLGYGIEQLLYTPFGGAAALDQPLPPLPGTDVGILFGVSFLAMVSNGFSLAWITPLAFLVGLGILVTLFTIVARKMLLILLVLFSPVAFVMMVLPNTKRGFDIWWSFFTKALIMFPMIMALFAAGRIFALITAGNSNPADVGTPEGFFIRMIGIIALFAPFFLIPFTFRFAGGLIATLGGFVNDRSRGIVDSRRKAAQEKMAQNKAAFDSGNRFNEGNFVGARMNALGRRKGAGFSGRYGFSERGKQRMAQINDSHALGVLARSEGAQAIQFRDDALRAGTYGSYDEAVTGMTNRDLRSMVAAENSDRLDSMVAAENTRRTGLGQATMDAVETARFRQVHAADANMNEDQEARFRQAHAGEAQNRSVQAARSWQAAMGKFSASGQNWAARQLVSTGTGYDDIVDMQETIARASNGDVNTANSIVGFSNSETKKAGRFDLSPGYGALSQGVQAEMRQAGTAEANRAAAVHQTWTSSTTYDLSHGKPAAMRQYADHWVNMLNHGNQEQRGQAAVALTEMQNMLPGAHAENQAVINDALLRAGIDHNRTRTETFMQPDGTRGTRQVAESTEEQLTRLSGNALTASEINGLARVYDRAQAERSEEGAGGPTGRPPGEA